MNRIWAVLMVMVLALGSMDADARRLGGGSSFGKQSGNVTQRNATTPQSPSGPGQQSAAPAAGAQSAGAAAAAPRRPGMGAMLGGLAAGLGLAWLASSLGLGEAFGQILLFGLLAMVIMVAVGWFMRNRAKASASPRNAAPFAFQGAGGVSPAAEPKPYRPENVGNDASARPWERNTMSGLDTAMANPQTQRSMIGSALSGSQTWGIPAGFDVEGFLRSAKTNFVTLQAAWDKSDIRSLRSMMTDEMLAEIQNQLAEREAHTGGPANHTDVVMIDAQLLGIEDVGDDYLASVEFSGMIREEPSAGPSPFREVWNMTKPKSGNSGWLVAGVQALQ